MHRKACYKQKRKFEDYKHCLEATQIENKRNQLEKIKLMWTVSEKLIKNL